jgi:hypothetical protein
MRQHPRKRSARAGLAPLAWAAATVVCAGCGGSTASTPASAYPGEVVSGAPDSHCAAADASLMVQPIGTCYTTADQIPAAPSGGSCGVAFSTSSPPDAGSGDDAGADAGDVSDYGPTMFGSAGDDDDCKYYVSWTSTPIKENVDTYFTVTAVRLSDMQPARCAGIRPDVSLTIHHGAVSPTAPSPEISPGVYKVGPIRFDAPGNTPGNYWTVRFHLYEECDDGQPDSPHGHAAFYVSVP